MTGRSLLRGPAGAPITTAGYVLLGLVGIAMTLPPGVAAPVWPAAGWAVVAVSLGGLRLVPAVWAGSLVSNLIALGGAQPLHIGAAAVAAVGAAGEAAVAALLVQRLVGSPERLVRPRDVFRFVALAGPVACLASVAVGPTIYLRLGLIPSTAGAFELLSWYIGDVIGVIGVTPLLLGLMAEPRKLWRPRVTRVGVPTLVALAFVVADFHLVRVSEIEAARAAFHIRAAQSVAAVEESVARGVENVESVASYFMASEFVTDDEFETFVERPLGRATGVVGLAWAPADSPDGAVRVAYARPDADWVGMDLEADPTRAALIADARRAGSAISTLLPDTGDGPRVLYAVWVGSGGQPGYVVGRLDLRALAAGARVGEDLARVGLTDVTEPNSPLPLLQAVPGAETWGSNVAIGGRQWRFSVGIDDVGLGAGARRQLVATFIFGVSFVAGCACLLLVLSGRTAELELETEQRRDAERELARAADELARSNRDLEQFAYVASHDLRAPLRAIRGLASWIAADAEAVLPATSRDNLGLLQNRAARLDAMVEGLLSYSRAGRWRQAPEPVALDLLAREAGQLAGLTEAFALEIAAPETVVAHRAALQQVLTNLIANAIRHHDRGGGVIRVTASPRGDFVEVRVSDDGPGIDPADHARVFELFKTLRSRDEVEGSGLGLSIVKRLVESEGGAVRIESGPGRGATFVFTWPRNTEHPPELSPNG